MNDKLSSDARYLSASQVRARYGDVSDQCLWRWLRDKTFPQPDMHIKSRRYWLEDTLVAWERRAPGRRGEVA
jgi:predicted DNA-binding transcriptional regulator AlpA